MLSTLSGETTQKLISSVLQRERITIEQLFLTATRTEGYTEHNVKEHIADSRLKLFYHEGAIDEGIESFCLDVLNGKIVFKKQAKKRGGLDSSTD